MRRPEVQKKKLGKIFFFWVLSFAFWLTMANVAIEPAALKKEKKGPKPQPSRKGKKAWRKNVDMTEVEEALEASRTDERVR